eukprot:9277796-Pyramimonas_sp.AAC.1
MGACGALVETLGYPVILGGGFNVDPSQIVETDLDGRTNGQWIVPDGHTCTNTGGINTYDYFLAITGLRKGASGVQATRDSDLSPRLPAQV